MEASDGRADDGSGSQATKPRTYTDEYRRQVVDMVASTGRTAMSVAAELSIHHTLISRWIRRRYGRMGSASAQMSQAASTTPLRPVPVPHADQAAEIARLRREVERLRMERDILKRMAHPVGKCQRRLDFPHLCRSKIPQFGVVISRWLDRRSCPWVAGPDGVARGRPEG